MPRTADKFPPPSSTAPPPTTTTTIAPEEVEELLDSGDHDGEHPFVCSLASIYSSGIHSRPIMSQQQQEQHKEQEYNNGDDDGEYTTTAEDASTLVLEPLGMSISFSQIESDEDDERIGEGGTTTTTNSAVVGWDIDEDGGVTSESRFSQRHSRSTEYHHPNSSPPTPLQHQDPPMVVSFWMLWRGPLMVYFVAMVLPTLSAYLLQQDHWNRLSTTGWVTIGQALEWWSHPAAPRLYWQEHIHPHYVVPVLEYLCQWDEGQEAVLEQELYTSIAYWMHRMNWCPIPPPVEEEEVVIYYRSIVVQNVADDWKQDLLITVALGTALAALRLLILLLASSVATVPRTSTKTKHNDDEQANKEDEHMEEKQPSSSSSDSFLQSPEDSLPGSAFFCGVYGSCCSYLAWKYFHTADFWPSFVGGTGDLSHCWDRIAVDADDAAYHHETTLLKYYVLAQASYSVHSITFGWVTQRPWRGSSAQVLVSLAQSVLALSLLLLAYTLPSVGRLVAVGMLALNVSQALRCLWQMLAPTDASGWFRRTITSLLYWGMVLPCFVATHFYVYPLLWHSATTADEWRLDLEQELWKGSADQFLRLGHACLVFLLLDAALSLQNLVEPVQVLRSGEERLRSH